MGLESGISAEKKTGYHFGDIYIAEVRKEAIVALGDDPNLAGRALRPVPYSDRVLRKGKPTTIRNFGKGVGISVVLEWLKYGEQTWDLRSENPTFNTVLECLGRFIADLFSVKSLFKGGYFGKVFALLGLYGSIQESLETARQRELAATDPSSPELHGMRLLMVKEAQEEALIRIGEAIDLVRFNSGGVNRFMQNLNDGVQRRVSATLQDCEDDLTACTLNPKQRAILRNISQAFGEISREDYRKSGLALFGIYYRTALVELFFEEIYGDANLHPLKYRGCSFDYGYKTPESLVNIPLAMYPNNLTTEAKAKVDTEIERIKQHVLGKGIVLLGELAEARAELREHIVRFLEYGGYRTRPPGQR